MGVAKTTLLLVGVLSLTTLSSALCPGESPCSGHGVCGASDKCTCYTNWDLQADCSQRRCPHYKAWASSAGDHSYVECAGRGTCDRATGACQCFEGYEGYACQRTTCPNNCNGHGRCRTVYEISGYSAWDAHRVQACECDPGFSGFACTERKCKLGDDPISTLDSAGAAQTDTVVTLTQTGSNTGFTGQYVLKYTTWTGEVYTTYPLNVVDTSAILVEEALRALPNNVVPAVTVTTTGAIAGTANLVVSITFSNEHTPGSQTLAVDTAGCDLDGCQPTFTAVSNGDFSLATTAGTKENVECSGRGTCNTENGLCTCYKGFTGEMCQVQTVIT